MEQVFVVGKDRFVIACGSGTGEKATLNDACPSLSKQTTVLRHGDSRAGACSSGFVLVILLSRVGVHGVAAVGGERGIQDRRDAHDDHVARGVDRLAPVRYHGVVAAGVKSTFPAFLGPRPRPRLDQVVATYSQMHLSGAKNAAVSA